MQYGKTEFVEYALEHIMRTPRQTGMSDIVQNSKAQGNIEICGRASWLHSNNMMEQAVAEAFPEIYYTLPKKMLQEMLQFAPLGCDSIKELPTAVLQIFYSNCKDKKEHERSHHWLVEPAPAGLLEKCMHDSGEDCREFCTIISDAN